jgi:hypothetical protein
LLSICSYELIGRKLLLGEVTGLKWRWAFLKKNNIGSVEMYHLVISESFVVRRRTGMGCSNQEVGIECCEWQSTIGRKFERSPWQCCKTGVLPGRHQARRNTFEYSGREATIWWSKWNHLWSKTDSNGFSSPYSS